jgi:hypothetical protein
MDAANCRHHSPEIFFPRNLSPHNIERAQQICDTCPVIAACQRYAERTRASDGIWAGQARYPLHHTYRPRTAQGCGTVAAYWRHRRHGETPCEACVLAQNQDSRDKRLARKAMR